VSPAGLGGALTLVRCFTILIVAPVDPTSRVLVVLNWTAEVRRRLGGRGVRP